MPLRSALSWLWEREAADAGSRVVLARVRDGLEQFAAAAGGLDGPLDASCLRFHQHVAAFLVASTCFCDVIRVLRELYRPSTAVHARAHEVERLIDAFTLRGRRPLVPGVPAAGVAP